MMTFLKQMHKLKKKKKENQTSWKAPSQAKECYNSKIEQDDPEKWKMS